MQSLFRKIGSSYLILILLCVSTVVYAHAQEGDTIYLPLVIDGQSAQSQSQSLNGKIGPEVFETLRRDGKASVLIMLNTSSFTSIQAANVNAAQTQAATLQRQVLSQLSANVFQAKHQFSTVPALVGTILSEKALKLLAADPNVQKVDLNEGRSSATLAQSVPLVGGDISHTNGITGKDVVVAVLDSGFDSDHPALRNALIHEACFVDTDGSINGIGLCPNGSDRQTGPGSGEDDNGHGTYVSGIIASDGRGHAAVGMAPDAKIVAIKVLDRNGFSRAASELVAALDYIFLELPEVKVVNMSLATSVRFRGVCDNETAWTRALAFSAEQLYNRGTLIVAASGNDYDSMNLPAPACISHVVSVAASTKQDRYAVFSNSNREVDLIAPGQGITSTSFDGGIGRNLAGTSFAAPHVAGCVALLTETGMSDLGRIKTRLTQSNVQITNPANSLTYPRLDCALSPSKPTPAVGRAIFVSSSSGGSVNNISFNDEDILVYHQDNNRWSLYFDGSDVGLRRNDINAFTLLEDSSILMSFNANGNVPGVGAIEDTDIVKFIPASLGENTSGHFELFLDGSDLGLTRSGEDIDSIAFTSSGTSGNQLVISTRGSFEVPGLSGKDEDLIVLNNARFGPESAGDWALYFDGSDVELTTSDEDINGVWISPDGNDIFLATKEDFAVTGVSGEASDIFVCALDSVGNDTNCAFHSFWAGDAVGFGEDIDGIAIGDYLQSSSMIGSK